jgi:hypothetical protein
MKYVKLSFKTGHEAIYKTEDEATYRLVRFMGTTTNNRFWPPHCGRGYIYDYIKSDGDVVVELTEAEVETETFLSFI